MWDHSPMSLADLAERCNISESSASRYLNGRIVPPADIAERILQVLSADIVATAAPEDKPNTAQAAVPPVLQIWEVYKEEIDILQANHANHITILQSNHAEQITLLQTNHANQISDLKRDKALLFSTVLVLFGMLVYFILDGVHGNWGIIRYTMSALEAVL